MDKEIRRRQSILATTGQGVIAFGLWEVIKINLYYLLGRGYVFDAMGMTGTEFEAGFALIFSWLFLMIFGVTNLLIKIYIGRAAIFEANNYHKDNIFYCLAIIMTIINALTLFSSVLNVNIDKHIPDFVASFLLDSTSLYMMIELISSTRKLRILRGEKHAVKHKKTM
jgi:hypothetical protein